MELPVNWQKKAAENSKKYKQWLQKVDVRKAVRQLPELHEQAFETVDCLACAACCKNYSPRFKTTDIRRISKALRMKESEFIDQYLKLDEDGDFVANRAPCPFLQENNACSIYEVRPSDCSRFPYTDEDVLLHRKQITLKNAGFCPAVFLVLQKLTGS